MKVERIDHVAINVRNLKEAAQFFADLLGTEFSSPAEFKELDITSLIDPLGIELVEPLTPDGPTSRTIEQRGEGLSLMSLKVTNLEEAMAEMKSRGIRLLTLVERPRMKAAIYHPKDTHGVMLELIEYKSEHPTIALRED